MTANLSGRVTANLSGRVTVKPLCRGMAEVGRVVVVVGQVMPGICWVVANLWHQVWGMGQVVEAPQ